MDKLSIVNYQLKVEAFFKTHKYLVEHLYSPVRRADGRDRLEDRLIGIKGSRGVGKTTFSARLCPRAFWRR